MMTLFDSYFNTTHLQGEQLQERIERADSQNGKILDWFVSHPNQLKSPSQIHALLFTDKTPLQSIRRALTVLTKRGQLERTNEKITGIYGEPEHLWRLKK